MAEELPTSFKTIPYSSFFKLWYYIQKELTEDERKNVLAKVGRAIGNEFNAEGIETLDQLFEATTKFLIEEWGIVDEANFEAIEDENGKVVKIVDHLSSCKMCFANTYYRMHDSGHPACMFPNVMLAILSKVKAQFGFKNLAYETVNKPGPVGECEMTWKVA
ncbi:MAG TPA: hypothetical protein VKM55_11070 [Candidatus Lokiarchaeia archaeon]|nr:hypothetical protein [Candidatus Lokiarchaeia archaeon]